MILREFIMGLLVPLFAFGLVCQTVCMPTMKEERVAKHRSSKEAAGRWTIFWGSRVQSSASEHTLDGDKYEALGGIVTPIGGRAKRQLNLPGGWSQAKVYNAVENVFAIEQEPTWYYPIEDTFLVRLCRGLRSDETKTTAPGVCEDLSYDVSTTVIQRDDECFIEINASLIPGVE